MASVGSPPRSANASGSGSGGTTETTDSGQARLLKAARNEQNKPLVLLRLVVIRAFNAYWLLTFFQPDEYFQALEPAWQMAFGQGSGAWLTWEWRHQLRSSLHPALFACVYWLSEQCARLLPFSSQLRPLILIAAPRVVQTLCAAAGDWYTWQLAVKLYGVDSSASWFALFMSMCNPFHWYCSTRTFSNSMETTMTIAALYYWPWELFRQTEEVKENPKGLKQARAALGSINGLRLSLVLAAVAVTLRPTNILIWLTVLLTTIMTTAPDSRSPVTLSTLVVLAREILLCGSLVLAASLVSDRLWFGEWTFPPYKWLYFNISHSLAIFYGQNDWHYYLSQGLPLLSTSYLPFVLHALYKTPSTGSRVSDATLRVLAAIVIAMVAALSLISHKEVRFVYPLLPILHVLAAPGVADFFTTRTPAPTKQNPLQKPKLRRKGPAVAALTLNALLASYLSLFHQPAPLNVMDFLRLSFERLHPEQTLVLPPYDAGLLASAEQDPTGDELFALFLTPCHSTPWRSHLVYPGLHARALTCEPPLHTAPGTPERETYRDEADRFYDDPLGFLDREMWAPGSDGERIPRYIVGFEGIEPWLVAFFEAQEDDAGGAQDVIPKGLLKRSSEPQKVKLSRAWEGWNGLFNEDWRRAGKLVVWDTGIYQ